MQDAAPFDDTREALRFALNAHQVSLPQPYMNRAMSDAPGPKPRRKKPTKAERAVMDAVGVDTLDGLRAMLKGRRRSTSFLRSPPRPTRGLDKAHLAGFILREFEKLPHDCQMILEGLCTEPVTPCSCGSPCCSGWRPVQRWVRAVGLTCEVLKQRALTQAGPGRVGLSTQPELRRTLVKDYFRGDKRRSLTELAAIHHLKDDTVARHRGWIHEWMEEQESLAWEACSWWFDQVGITGPWL